MTGYLLRRLPSAFGVLLLASFAIFLVLRAVPGDPAETLAGSDPSPAAVDAIRHDLGLDRPLLAQYASWLGHAVRGDFGRSYLIGGSVSDLLGQRIGNTVELTLGALVFSVTLGLVLGVLGATVKNRFGQTLLSAFNSVSLVVPGYVTGFVFVFLFAVTWQVLPAGGHESILADPQIGFQYVLMPALVLALPVSAILSRYVKDGIEQALSEDYARTAKSLGVPPRRLLWRHALPNALPPVLTALGMQIGVLLGGAVVIEAVFAWPGLGTLAEQAVTRRDYPVVQALLLFLVAVFVVVQLLTDIAYALLDPRVRLG
ncbi:ABC transporter permease [Yinghuangia seranimata]|uniref:ABC transporter permease n=1 Tax=Yinghuangia seranimata TaxID=408067 RepID=UPI00248BBFE2|nr:ABC transporter permease [Yinghuangia seranimata]MDI2127463.1 ABC transporter permease [Yinghuangia seranimata]